MLTFDKKKIMKTLFSALFIFTAISGFSQSYYVGAGTTYSEGISGYASIGTTKKLSDYMGYLGEVQFVSQNSKPGNTSINGVFAYRVYPIKNLSINAGFQIGIYTSDNLSDEAEPLGIGKMDLIAGLSYSIRRFEVVTRYNHPLDDVFDGLYQAGIAFMVSR